MKTFEQCLDEVINKYLTGKIDWDFYDLTKSQVKEAAELYREEGIKEAVKLAQERGEPISSHFYKYTEEEIQEKLKS